MALSGVCEASHAGSWYTGDPDILSQELEGWLQQVPDELDGIKLPVPGARIIIAPHAGYSYSGPCAAWAYKALDLHAAKRVFILGPSHTYYLSGCALTTRLEYETPFGNFKVDEEIVQDLRRKRGFAWIPRENDDDEHSLEMHLPYLWKRLEQTHAGDASKFPPIVPIMVGDNSATEEKYFGEVLAPHLKDPENAFIVSSDLCHWGARSFRYSPHCTAEQIQAFLSDPGSQPDMLLPEAVEKTPANSRRPGHRTRTERWLDEGGDNSDKLAKMKAEVNIPIHETIKILDHLAIDAAESGLHDKFYHVVQMTGNTICGRHPIGVAMAALEALRLQKGSEDAEKAKFKFVRYERSSLVTDKADFSVSYPAAYAVP